jgi:hypothetical protein
MKVAVDAVLHSSQQSHHTTLAATNVAKTTLNWFQIVQQKQINTLSIQKPASNLSRKDRLQRSAAKCNLTIKIEFTVIC